MRPSKLLKILKITASEEVPAQDCLHSKRHIPAAGPPAMDKPQDRSRSCRP